MIIPKCPKCSNEMTRKRRKLYCDKCKEEFEIDGPGFEFTLV